ncbi:ADP-ribosylation factor-like protein 2-binding protein isoform X2 [Sinocyclocheilus rhinocerous]|uniref:ADP-ribosylation factor-like protein 2-binding protein isoform X2 n=1 Tax=Sinocyclocheilus rhinocerous TaxID=307959 RepID=UPI0007B7C321|nr:PREDICTED: ADP-ribosylation factor-like protein 2-binding protein isoform X2 [Sinocyclocheilus rhinocerous]
MVWKILLPALALSSNSKRRNRIKGKCFLPNTFRTRTRSPVAVAAATSGRTFGRYMMDAREIDLLGVNENIVEMQNLEEEDFAVSKSSDADAEFDMIIGNIEDIIMEDEFQHLQQSFMEKYYLDFDDSEENKLSYTTIFNEYIEILEKQLEQQLVERIPGFKMDVFTHSLKQHKDEVSGDILDMLLTFTDFMAFKEMFIDYRAFRGKLSCPVQMKRRVEDWTLVPDWW